MNNDAISQQDRPQRLLIDQLFALQLLILWCLGSWPIWVASQGLAFESLLKPVSVISIVCWLAYVWTMRANATSKQRAWLGTLQLAACWMTFMLFKAIRLYWIDSTADGFLLAADRFLFQGKSLPEHVLALENAWISDILSIGYFLFFLLIMVPAAVFTCRRTTIEARAYFRGLALIYFVGFIGYLALPAAGPFIAFPDVFPYPPVGGSLTHFFAKIVMDGVTGMDVFPSLHTGISLYVFGFFYSGRKTHKSYTTICALLAPIVLSIMLATVYLRYHYGIDVMLGLLLGWLVVRSTHRFRQENHA